MNTSLHRSRRPRHHHRGVFAVSGHAVAGGLELALLADLPVADTGAVHGVFCRRWGVPLIDGGTVRLQGASIVAAEGVAGAARFVAGAGRHGQF